MGQDVLPKNKYIKKVNLDQLITIALSENQHHQYVNTINKQANEIIPWGINKHEYPPPKKNRTIDILGVGSLNKIKNYSLFIDIINQVKKQIPHLNVVIIGYGPEEEKLTQKIQSLNLADTIQLMGCWCSNIIKKLVYR